MTFTLSQSLKYISVVFLLLTVLPTPSHGQFFTKVILDAGRETEFTRAIWFDDNNDGYNDLHFFKDTEILINNQDETFSEAGRTLPVINQIRALTDLDKNGTTDILNYTSGESVLYNNEDGSFSQVSLEFHGINYQGHWTDIDGDGDLDYANTTISEQYEEHINKLEVRLNEDGQFINRTTFNYAITFRAFDKVYAHDIDRDGDFDLVVINSRYNQLPPAIRVYKNVSGYQYQLDSTYTFSNLSGSPVPRFGDFNNDGYIDFAFTQATGSKIMKNNAGTFELLDIDLINISKGSLSWGDYDNDGDLDLLAAGGTTGSNKLYLYENNGDETFDDYLIFQTSFRYFYASWVEIDGDGFLDISVRHRRCEPSFGFCSDPDQIDFYLNDFDANPNDSPSPPNSLQYDVATDRVTWQSDQGAEETPIASMMYNVALETVDEKIIHPFSDLTTGHLLFPQLGNMGYNNFYSTKYLASGDYTIKVQAIDGGMLPSAFTSTIAFSVAEAPTNLTLTGQNSTSLSFSWQNPLPYDQISIERSCDGSSFREISVEPGDATQYVDGDIAACENVEYRIRGLVSTGNSAYSEYLQVNRADFELSFYDQEESFWNASRIDWADFDGDGDNDAVCYKYPNIQIYRNDGDISFVKIFDTESPIYPSNLNWRDMNEDNLIDIVINNGSDGTIWYVNNGTNDFTPANIENPLPAFFIYADIDNDAIDELIYFDESSLYLKNDDDVVPTFVHEIHSYEGFYGNLYAQDFNGDGYVDILAIGNNSAYLINNGDRSFSNSEIPIGLAGQEIIYSGPSNLSITDSNQDGIMDIFYHARSNLGAISFDGSGNLIDYDEVELSISNTQEIFCVDMNNDGKSDVLFDSQYADGQTYSPALFYSSPAEYLRSSFPEYITTSGRMFEVVDIDGDSDLDMLTFTHNRKENEFQGVLFENKAADFLTQANQKPTSPTEISYEIDGDKIKISWNAGSDDLTPPTSLFYNYYLQKDENFIVSPMSDLATGFRQTKDIGNAGLTQGKTFTALAAGNYEIAVQSIDNGLLGSEFSEVLNFSVLDAPELESVEQVNYNTIELQWQAVDAMTEYIIKRADGAFGPFNQIAQVSADELSYTDSELNRNQQYYYRVTGIGNNVLTAPLEVEQSVSDFIRFENSVFQNLDIRQAEFGDFDNDKDQDLAVITDSKLILYANDGDGAFSENQSFSQQFLDVYGMQWSDINSDNQLDLVVAAKDSEGFLIQIFQNQLDHKMTHHAIRMDSYLGSTSMALGDYTNNGRIDILFGQVLIERTGEDSYLQRELFEYNVLPSVQFEIFELVDFDMDQDLDLVMGGGQYWSTSWIENQFPEYSDRSVICEECKLGKMVSYGDFDSNGKWDFLFLEDRSSFSHTAEIAYNPSTASFRTEELSTAEYYEATMGVGDLDNNGWSDVFVVGRTSYSTENPKSNQLIYNRGIEGIDVETVGPWVDDLGEVRLAHLDDDTDIDLTFFSDTGSGLTTFLSSYDQSESGNINELPSAPGSLAHYAHDNTIYFSWDAASDTETPSSSLTYNLCIVNGQGEYVVSPLSHANGKRMISEHGNVNFNTSWYINELAEGTYYWKVQAIDAAFGSSEFSEEMSFYKAANSSADITYFNFSDNNSSTTIDPGSISIEVSPAVDVTALIATFSLSAGATAQVDNTVQQSGVTVNDFSEPITYVVTAEDGSTTKNWTVKLIGNVLSVTSDITGDKIVVYPNPVKDNLIVKGKFDPYTKMEVINLLGEKVMSQTLTEYQREFDRLNINTERLPIGNYMLIVSGSSNFQYVKFTKGY